jgi:hypothetical protein
LMMVPVIWSIFAVGVNLAYLALPCLVFGTLGWFMWRIWGRVIWRANHISHIREKRLLDEAARR